MARFFEPITADELQKKIWEALRNGDASDLKNDDDDAGAGNSFGFYGLSMMKSLTATVEKDLGKVEFDLENVMGPGDYNRPDDPKHGFETLDNGLTYFGMSAGGDWEHPVYFIIYWDGSKLRGYIPEDGNMWNTDTNQAYGNDEEKDKKNIHERWPELKPTGEPPYDYYEPPGWDKELLLADIKARILPKNETQKKNAPKPKKEPSTPEEKLREKVRILSAALRKVQTDVNTFYAEETQEEISQYIDEAFERAKKYDEKTKTHTNGPD